MRRRLLAALGKYGTLVFLLIMVVIFSIAKPDIFPTTSNLLLILNSISLTAIIAGGLTLVLGFLLATDDLQRNGPVRWWAWVVLGVLTMGITATLDPATEGVLYEVDGAANPPRPSPSCRS